MTIQITNSAKLSIISIILTLAIGYTPVPVSALNSPEPSYQFLTSVDTNDSDENGQQGIVGVLYLNDSIAFNIGQQPARNDNFVSPLPNYVTEYRAASNYGTIGLLAHNYLAGQYFFQLLPGHEIELVYGENRKESFVVIQTQKYQALSPNSSSSSFTDLETGEYLTASQLFRKMYASQTGHVVLQTCIYADQNPTWGRLFIIAEPVSQTITKNHLSDNFR